MNARTILYDRHLAAKARMVDFGGWDMPLQYDGIIAEHNRVRTHVGIFDTCHMDAFLIKGDLHPVVSQDLKTLAVGACRYGFLLNEEGGIIDDQICYCLGEAEWMMVVNAATAPNDFAWVSKHVDATDLRDTQSKIDVQGPHALAEVTRILGFDLSDLKRFRWKRINACIVSRTGYTGEEGIEIYAPHETIASIWDTLLANGIQPCGLGARDTLRLEAGLPLYGHELDITKSPAEANMMRYAAKEEPFIGKAAMLERAKNPKELLVAFKLEGRQSARHGQAVKQGEAIIGTVTSGSFCPTISAAVGFAYVKPQQAALGTTFSIDNGRTLLPATVVAPPFYRKKQEKTE
jgi:aminomethyltransferase